MGGHTYDIMGHAFFVVSIEPGGWGHTYDIMGHAFFVVSIEPGGVGAYL